MRVAGLGQEDTGSRNATVGWSSLLCTRIPLPPHPPWGNTEQQAVFAGADRLSRGAVGHLEELCPPVPWLSAAVLFALSIIAESECQLDSEGMVVPLDKGKPSQTACDY